MTKKAGGDSEFQIQDTSITPQSTGASMMGFKSPGRAGW